MSYQYGATVSDHDPEMGTSTSGVASSSPYPNGAGAFELEHDPHVSHLRALKSRTSQCAVTRTCASISLLFLIIIAGAVLAVIFLVVLKKGGNDNPNIVITNPDDTTNGGGLAGNGTFSSSSSSSSGPSIDFSSTGINGGGGGGGDIPPTNGPTEFPPTTEAPTIAPTVPVTDAPTTTTAPTVPVTDAPTDTPTVPVTDAPTDVPTVPVTEAPTKVPTDEPTATGTPTATDPPTTSPTPTDVPTGTPTNITTPTNDPVVTTAPTSTATDPPTTDTPTTFPTPTVTVAPTDGTTTTSTPTTSTPTATSTPTTSSSTTEAPTTSSPTTTTTIAPTTDAPTIESPTTTAPTPTPTPTTDAPTTQSPTTAAPTTTEAPTTAATTAAPTTAAPTTVAPTTQSPTTEAPTATPTTQSPTTQSPTTQSPTTAAPTTKTPTATPTPTPKPYEPAAPLPSDRCTQAFPQSTINPWVSTATCDQCTAAGCGWCTIPVKQSNGPPRYYTSCREKRANGTADVDSVCIASNIPDAFKAFPSGKSTVFANAPSSAPSSGTNLLCSASTLAEHPSVPPYPVSDPCHTVSGSRSCSACVEYGGGSTLLPLNTFNSTCGWLTLPVTIDGVTRWFTSCRSPKATATATAKLTPVNTIGNKTKIWAQNTRGASMPHTIGACKDTNLADAPYTPAPYFPPVNDVCSTKTTCAACGASTGCGWCSTPKIGVDGSVTVLSSCRARASGTSTTASIDNVCLSEDPRVPATWFAYNIVRTFLTGGCPTNITESSLGSTPPPPAVDATQFNFNHRSNVVRGCGASPTCGECTLKPGCGWCGNGGSGESSTTGRCVNGFNSNSGNGRYSPICGLPSTKFVWFSTDC